MSFNIYKLPLHTWQGFKLIGLSTLLTIYIGGQYLHKYRAMLARKKRNTHKSEDRVKVKHVNWF